MKLTSQSKLFVFDVESIGLRGEAFAVGFVMSNGPEIFLRHYFAMPRRLATGTAEDRAWCEKNIPEIQENCTSAYDMRFQFWNAWKMAKENGAIMCADVAWPVEAKFLLECAQLDGNEHHGPYPLVDIASVMLAAGMDPMVSYDRREGEQSVHDPVADSAQSHRLLVEALRRLENQDRWVVEAEAVLGELDFPKIGEALSVPLGRSVPEEILPGIKALKARIENLEKDNP
jgi:hypothetical protein